MLPQIVDIKHLKIFHDLSPGEKELERYAGLL